MKSKKNSGVSQKDLDKGHCEGEHKGGKDSLDESPLNSNWRDLDDGGFLGRPKGGER